MSKAMLVGVDASLSLPTRYALEAACCQFREQPSPERRVLLLHVIQPGHPYLEQINGLAGTPCASAPRDPGSL